MYVSEKGDQMKRYNTHDGLALLELSKSKKLELGIISSGFTEHMVQDRAALLGIERVYVGREPKLSILEQWCKEMNISPKEVAFIGDDRKIVELQREGLKFNPNLMLIQDSDQPAIWYHRIKKAWAESVENGTEFVNPVRERVLRWKS